MSVVSAWAGACTEEYIELLAKVTSTSGTARFLIADNPLFVGGTYYGPETIASTGVVDIGIHGLDPDTAYYYAVEDNGSLDNVRTGKMYTHPVLGEPASFMFAAASCAGGNPQFLGPMQSSGLVNDRISDHPVFDTIREAEPRMFIHTGDMSYYNPGGIGDGTTDGSLAGYRNQYDASLSCNRQAKLYRSTQLVYAWDDHDYGPNDSDGTYALKGNAAQVYRERVPHYPLAQSSGPIYHSFTYGRVLFVVIDTRYERDPELEADSASKIMLSSTQLSWVDSVLGSSDAEALVFVNPTPWMGRSGDTWAGYSYARADLGEIIAAHGWSNRMVMINGDYHGLAMDDGVGNPEGDFPVYVLAALDSGYFADNTPSYQYNMGPTSPGNNRYGLLQVRDYGHELSIATTGMIGTTPWRTHSITVDTSTPFSTTFPGDPAPWTIEIAPGGNPVDESTWTWVDITQYVRYSDRVSIGYGRADEWSETGTTTCGMTLDNRDGRFSPRNPLGPWYGQLARNTPLRVRWNTFERFLGFVIEWPPRWDQSGNNAYATIQASGIFRRLAQGQKALRSALYREINAPTRPKAVAYWPCEDGDTATAIASAVSTTAPMKIVGEPELASYSDLQCSDPLPTMKNASFEGRVPNYAQTGTTILRMILTLPTEGTPDGILATVITTGSAERWQLHYTQAGGTLGLRIVHRDGTILNAEGAGIAFDLNGQRCSVGLEMVQNGSDINWKMLVVKIKAKGITSGTEWSGTLTGGRTVGAVIRVRISPNRTLADAAIGHVFVSNDSSSLLNTDRALVAHWGELAGNRLARLCDEEGIPFTPPTASADTVPMGPQLSATLLELLRQCEAADGGTLYEVGAGIGYRSRNDRYNPPVALALDVSAGDLAAAPEPTDDDQTLRNDVTAQRLSGSSVRVIDQAHAEREGVYDEQIDVNVAYDSVLGDIANWRIHLGTVDEMRWPKLSLDLARNPGLIAGWLTLKLGQRLTVAHALPQIPGVEVDVLVEGWTERLGPYDWTAELNAIPASPWNVGIIGDDQFGRLDTEDSELNAAITSTATSVPVKTNAGPTWMTGTFTAEYVPPELVTFVAANSADSVGTSGLTVPLPAGWENGDVALLIGSVNDATKALTGPPGWTLVNLTTTGTMQAGVWRKVLGEGLEEGEEAAEVNPVLSITGTGRIVGAVSVYSGVDLTNPVSVIGTAGTRGASSTSTVAPAITTLEANQRVVGLFSEKSAAVSVTDPAGTTRRVARLPAASGGVSALIVDEQKAAAGSTGTRTATYSVATANGYGVLVALKNFPGVGSPGGEPAFDITVGGEVMRVTAIAGTGTPQTFTVERSINGIVKAHAAGTDVRLRYPLILAL